MVFPPLLWAAGAMVAKRTNVWVVYNMAKTYGLPRVFRRLGTCPPLAPLFWSLTPAAAEANRQLSSDPATRALVQRALREGFRTPTRAYVLLRDSTVADFAGQVAAGASQAAPKLVVDMARVILGRSNLGKAVAELEAMTAARRPPSL